ncbi:hypothetical protein HYW40_03400 [Candidatus Curtissbacteria bacterium]|nr:hypothetical protein [Candidatus Curtissbacteria bacterium]
MPQKVSASKFMPAKVNYTEKLQKINIYLATVFLLLWIFVGIFATLVVIQSVKQGALNGILGKQQPPKAQIEPQTEADLPGVGTVNIACVESALSQEAIGKIFQKGDTSDLTAEEKSKLDPCLIEKESVTP